MIKIDSVTKNRIVIYRERPATKAERKRDKDANLMCEWVAITFSNDSPKIEVTRNLCGV